MMLTKVLLRSERTQLVHRQKGTIESIGSSSSEFAKAEKLHYQSTNTMSRLYQQQCIRYSYQNDGFEKVLLVEDERCIRNKVTEEFCIKLLPYQYHPIKLNFEPY